MTNPLELLIVLAVVAGLVLFLSAPLRRIGSPAEDLDLDPTHTDRAELEAAREAKYRELRDADLDHRTGKLSDADYAELDATLRGEAIEILRALDKSESDTDLSAAPDGGASALPSAPS